MNLKYFIEEANLYENLNGNMETIINGLPHNSKIICGLCKPQEKLKSDALILTIILFF